MLARVSVVLCLLALLAPAAALAQDQSPFAPLPPAQTLPQDQPVQTSSNTTDGNGGLRGWQQALIFAAGGVLLLGIGWAIIGDARNRAPVEETTGQHESRERAEAERRRRKQQARARAKRAKQARRKNRV